MVPLFALIALLFGSIRCEGDCPDIHGRIIAPGLHYVPGPDTCTLCICENGQPKWCKAVLCSPPQDCKSLFRQGNTCCEFICLDDALNTHPDSVLDGHQDLGLRLIASAVTVVLFLSILFFTVHRLRRRKLLRAHFPPGGQMIGDDQRSLASIGYIGGGLGYDDAPVHFASLWKPPGNYFPRGEAPPPYDEAVAQARAEAIAVHRTFPLNLDNPNRPTGRRSPYPHAGPYYLNGDMQDRQLVIMDNNRSANFTTQHSISSSGGNNNFISTFKITSSLAPLTNRNRTTNGRDQTDCGTTRSGHYLYNSSSPSSSVEPLINNNATQQPRILPALSMDASRHRTIPHMLGMLDDQLNSRSYSHFKQQRALTPKIFHDNASTLPEDVTRRSTSSSRFSADTNNPRLIADNSSKCIDVETENVSRFPRDSMFRYAHDNASLRAAPPGELLRNNDNSTNVVEVPAEMSHVENNSVQPNADLKQSSTLNRQLERHPLLPLASETTTCGCSYDSENLEILNDDQDDYHSECENCKSANGSRYYLDESEEGSELCETMTLHRRPLQEHSTEDLNQLPTSLTLPVKTKRNRCPTGSRDAWFSSMPGTSSSEED